ncbi:hypothetical protein CHUAL_012410 [Chamberlinius hualienensis]
MVANSQSGAKIPNSNSESLTFTKAIKHLLYLHNLFGINISNSVKWQLVYDILFAIHLLMSVMYIAFACVKADFDSDDNQIVVLSAGSICVGILNLLTKLSHRRQCRNTIKLIKDIDEVLKRFDGKEAVQLEKIEKMSWKLFLFPILSITIHLIYAFETFSFGHNHVDFGSNMFQDLSKRYKINHIYNLTVAPFNVAYEYIITLMMIPVFSSLKFSVDQLISLQPTYKTAVKFIKTHRDIRRLYHLANAAFSTNILLGMTSMLIFILAFARTVTVNFQAISWATVIKLIVLSATLYSHLIFISSVNEKLRQSNGHLLQLSYHLGRKKTINLVSDKLDLYVSGVNLNFPFITAGNWIKADRRVVVIVCIIAVY